MTRLGRIALVVAIAGCGNTGTMPIDTPDSGAADLAGGPLVIAPGDVVELSVADGIAGARIATPAGDERYLLVLASMTLDTGGDIFDYQITTDAAPANAGTPVRVTGCSIDSAPWRAAQLPVEQPPAGAAPRPGDTRQLTIGVNGGKQVIDAQVAAVGKRAVVWVDVTPGHPANLDMAVIMDFLTDFDELILPRERTLFGVESDLDGDGRIGLVFTSLTYKTAVAFFTGCDLAAIPGCYKGNGGEFLYLTPPAAIPPPYNTPSAIKETLSHELGHLIHFNRKVLRNQVTQWDDSSYMIEGFGAFTQDASGYQAGNLYVTMAGLDGIDDFTLGHVLVDNTPYDRTRDGVLRGGAYLFVRWLYDRGGGDMANADGSIGNQGGPALLRALLDDKASVATAIGTVAKAKEEDVAMDYFTTLAASNREQAGGTQAQNPCFRYLPAVNDPKTTRQRGADMFTSFHGMKMSGPLLQTAAGADGQLLAGGVEYIELVASGAELDVTVTVMGAANVRVRVIREK